jgi:hypothetical protein
MAVSGVTAGKLMAVAEVINDLEFYAWDIEIFMQKVTVM